MHTGNSGKLDPPIRSAPDCDPGTATATVAPMPKNLKVAFATNDGKKINQHFGHLRGFLVVEIADGQDVGRTEFARPAQADQMGERRQNHVALLDPIADCDVLIAGGMGLPMAGHVHSRGLDLILTSVGEVDDALDRYVAGTLEHEAERSHQPRH